MLGCMAIAFCWNIADAQTVQWADRVLEYSSEYTDAAMPGQYAARQALGIPSCDPNTNTKNHECAWSPSDASSTREEYIKVAYDIPQQVRQVAISECLVQERSSKSSCLIPVARYTWCTPIPAQAPPRHLVA